MPKRSSASSQAVSVRHKGSAIAGVPAVLEKPLDSALDESVQPRNQEVIPEEEVRFYNSFDDSVMVILTT